MESIMLLVWRMKQEIEFQKTRVLANTMILTSQAGGQDANKGITSSWEEYRHTMFPFQKHVTQTQDQIALDYLRKEVARGPVSVKPLAPLTPSSGARRKKRRAKRHEG